MIVSLIVAASENNVIGKENKLPWNQPEDLKFFKNTTWGAPVLMGRKTFESMGKALPGRQNIVITSDSNWQANNTVTAPDIDAALKKAEATNSKEVFITGGGEVFKQAIKFADKIYITRMHAQVEGDVFFPEINTAEWELAYNNTVQPDEKNKYAMSFQTWLRRAPNPIPYS